MYAKVSKEIYDNVVKFNYYNLKIIYSCDIIWKNGVEQDIVSFYDVEKIFTILQNLYKSRC